MVARRRPRGYSKPMSATLTITVDDADPDVAWAKLRVMREGADLATARLL